MFDQRMNTMKNTNHTSARRTRKPPCKCGKPSIPGLVKGVSLCQSGWSALVYGDAKERAAALLTCWRSALVWVAFALLVNSPARAEAFDATRIADAIYRLEGGTSTRFPYGVRSIKTTSTAHARRICINTINNARARWVASGSRGLFLDYLADRYCPRASDPAGNRNWKRNIKAMVRQ